MSFETTNAAAKDKEPGVFSGREIVQQKILESYKHYSKVFDENLLKYVVETQEVNNPGFTKDELIKAFSEEVESLCKFEVIKIGNFEVRMFGFPHQAAAIPVIREKLEKEIRGADLVFLETGVQTTDPEVARLKKLRSDPGSVAFYQVENIAKAYEKPIVLSDPGYSYSSDDNNEYQDRLLKLEKDVQDGLLVGGLGAAISGIALAGVAAANAMDEKKISRRNFLKIGLGAALATAGTGALDISSNNKKHKDISLETVDERYRVYNFFDYRDVVIAESLAKVAELYTDDGEVVTKAALIYGAGHIPGIKFYLDNPKVRSLKLRAYEPFLKNSEQNLTMYEFEPDESVSAEDLESSDVGQWVPYYQAPIVK